MSKRMVSGFDQCLMSSIVAMPDVVTDPLPMAYADGDTAQSPKLLSI